jgi:hypothetical protein
VLVKARKFKDLSVTNGNKSNLEQLEPIEQVPRLLQAPEYSSGTEPPIVQEPRRNDGRGKLRVPRPLHPPSPRTDGRLIDIKYSFHEL